MASDIRHFILRSYIDPLEKQKIIDETQRKRKVAMDTFDKIYATFGFQHHEGTDKNMELKVVKAIMIREGLLMSLSFICDKAMKTNTINGNTLLELLSQIRESTLNYLEALILWRQQSTNQNDSEQPLAFQWEKRNYTLKITHDLDFLAKNPVVIETLNLSPEQLYLNPLMLNNNLEDPNTWMDPYDRASLDMNGSVDDPAFENRLRLRFAERILLQEIEIYGDGGNDCSDVFITQDENVAMKSPVSTKVGQNVMVGSSVLETEDQSDQDRGFRSSDDSAASNQAVFYQNPQSRGSGSYSLGLSEPPSRVQSASMQVDSLQSLEYGHDVFTGHWMENRLDSDDIYGMSSHPGIAAASEEDGVLFMENGNTMAYYETQALNPSKQMLYRDNLDRRVQDGHEVVEERSVGSLAKSTHSIESVGSLDAKALLAVTAPPKFLVLAASCCVILFSHGNEIPMDVSWKAFLRLTKKINLGEAMNHLDPLTIPAFKIIAIQPIIKQLLREDTTNGLQDAQWPMQTYTTIMKLIKWVQQFTTSALKKQIKRKEGQKRKIALEPIKTVSKRIDQQVSPDPDLDQGKELNKIEKIKTRVKTPIPKVDLSLQAVHTEVLANALPNPVLLVLLTSPEVNADGAAVEPQKDGNQNGLQRLVIKAYDTSTSKEALIHVNMREQSLLLNELIEKYGNHRARLGFRPSDIDWWKENVKHIVKVQAKSSGQLNATISKKMIDELVFKINSPTKSSSPSNRLSPSATQSKRPLSSHDASASKTKGKNALMSKTVAESKPASKYVTKVKKTVVSQSWNGLPASAKPSPTVSSSVDVLPLPAKEAQQSSIFVDNSPPNETTVAESTPVLVPVTVSTWDATSPVDPVSFEFRPNEEIRPRSEDGPEIEEQRGITNEENMYEQIGEIEEKEKPVSASYYSDFEKDGPYSAEEHFLNIPILPTGEDEKRSVDQFPEDPSSTIPSEEEHKNNNNYSKNGDVVDDHIIELLGKGSIASYNTDFELEGNDHVESFQIIPMSYQATFEVSVDNNGETDYAEEGFVEENVAVPCDPPYSSNITEPNEFYEANVEGKSSLGTYSSEFEMENETLTKHGTTSVSPDQNEDPKPNQEEQPNYDEDDFVDDVKEEVEDLSVKNHSQDEFVVSSSPLEQSLQPPNSVDKVELAYEEETYADDVEEPFIPRDDVLGIQNSTQGSQLHEELLENESVKSSVMELELKETHDPVPSLEQAKQHLPHLAHEEEEVGTAHDVEMGIIASSAGVKIIGEEAPVEVSSGNEVEKADGDQIGVVSKENEDIMLQEHDPQHNYSNREDNATERSGSGEHEEQTIQSPEISIKASPPIEGELVTSAVVSQKEAPQIAQEDEGLIASSLPTRPDEEASNYPSRAGRESTGACLDQQEVDTASFEEVKVDEDRIIIDKVDTSTKIEDKTLDEVSCHKVMEISMVRDDSLSFLNDAALLETPTNATAVSPNAFDEVPTSEVKSSDRDSVKLDEDDYTVEDDEIAPN
eukprot:scaffold1355_cov154-Ochromonas_danica.AAC.18